MPLEPDLLERALTHRSYAYENGGLPTNERLEFLGDSVLGVVITSALFHNHPDLPEGQLAKLRASVVNMHALADVARTLGPQGLGPHLLLGKGEETTGGRDKASILADTLEALLGAIYLEHGLDIAGEVIHRLFDPLMAESAGPRRRAGLEDQPAGADRGARPGRAGLRDRRRRPGPRQDLHRLGGGGRRALRRLRRPQQEAGRAAGRRRGLAHPHRAGRGGDPPPRWPVAATPSSAADGRGEATRSRRPRRRPVSVAADAGEPQRTPLGGGRRLARRRRRGRHPGAHPARSSSLMLVWLGRRTDDRPGCAPAAGLGRRLVPAGRRDGYPHGYTYGDRRPRWRATSWPSSRSTRC